MSSIVALCVLSLSCDKCRVDPLYYVDSPSGKYTAILFDRDCGSTIGHKTNLSIVTKSAGLGRTGNTAILEGLVTVDVIWKDDKNIQVTHDATAKVYLFEKEFSGIRIHETMR